jgi:pimeloyl-ACP methyl ester carboxylesterase
MTTDIRKRSLTVNGIRMHVAEAGSGPLVLLCHGWPELGYSWRHQIPALAEAGFRVAVPDMRGYGQTDAPSDAADYSIMHLVGDMVALVSALGERDAIIVGHDWGANVAWHAAMLRPDVFRAVAAMSVPHRGRGPAEPLAMLRKSGLNNYYFIYFQEPGVAEAEFERDLDTTFRKIFYGPVTDAERARKQPLMVPEGGGFLDRLDLPSGLPSWSTEADLTVFKSEFARSGFRGGLNWYRNLTRNWELTAPWQGAVITRPALFIAGTRDPVIAGERGQAALKNMQEVVPAVQTRLIEGAGHWLQQERPAEVNSALIEFLRAL